METITVAVLNDHARRLLEALEALGGIIIQPAPHQPTAPAQRRTFKALSVDTRGFKFNREEANER